MLKDLFRKKQYATITLTRDEIYKHNTIDTGITPQSKDAKGTMDSNSIICSKCNNVVNKEDLRMNFSVCPKCNFHNRISAMERLDTIVDTGTFKEMNGDLRSKNPLGYPGYEEKIKTTISSSGITEAVVTGEGRINGHIASIGVMDSNFIMGSMGSVVGERLTRLIEFSLNKRNPLIILCASGGARMQEGIISLMQMAKVSAALKKLSDAGILYISVITDPTTGGITASFAMLGDIIIAEPGAIVGFAGKRVVEQTIKQKLPDGFQTSEFMLNHGFVDMIVKRHDLKSMLSKIIMLHS